MYLVFAPAVADQTQPGASLRETAARCGARALATRMVVRGQLGVSRSWAGVDRVGAGELSEARAHRKDQSSIAPGICSHLRLRAGRASQAGESRGRGRPRDIIVPPTP